jgi:hypothetical protein
MAIAIRRENPLPLLRASLAVVVPAAILLAAVAGADAWRDLVLFPATDFSRVRGEPYPHLVPRAGPIVAWIAHPEGLAEARGALLALARYLGCFLPQVFLVAGIAIVVQRGRTAPDGLVLAVALLPLYWLAAHVQQNTHVYTMAALSMIVFATAWETGVLPRWALGVAGAFHAVGVLAAPVLAVAVAARALPDAQVLPDPGASLVLVPRSRYDELRPITGFVRRNVPAEEPIYVGLERHEATVISSPILYYLCDRAPAVRYHELHPGITDREAIQAEMLGWIEGRRVQCVVLWRFGWSTARQDAVHERLRRATPDGGSDTLDLWIEENFETVVASGEFEVLWRRP